MERIEPISVTLKARHYWTLGKPGIIFGNSLTLFGGFALASKGRIEIFLLFSLLIGVGCIIGAASTLNSVIDKELDEKMERTKNRPLVTGAISIRSAKVFALVLALMGSVILLISTNLLTFLIAIAGLVIYVFPYSLLKYKTVHATVVGSLAGAVPPLIGYTAVTSRIDLSAFLHFLMIALWQMPHFYAISIFRLSDYVRGKIPVLSIVKGMKVTKVQIFVYIVAFTLTSLFFAATVPLSPLFLYTSLFLGAIWLFLALQGFSCLDDKKWARKVFFFSLIVVMMQSIIIPFCLGRIDN